MHEAVTAAFGAAARGLPPPRPPPRRGRDRWLLDLPAANRHALREAGVPGAQIHATALTTGPADSGDFFSDRAARPCGRLALVARLQPRR